MMSWFIELSLHQSAGYMIFMLAAVIAIGLMVGKLQVRGIRLGSAGVLFVGLLIGHVGHPVDPGVLGFLAEFGLVLFVFTIGLQIGPGFVASLRADGLRLNLLASSVVLLGSLLAWAAIRLLAIEPAGVLGVLAGAVTNTPSLGATQQTLKALPDLSERIVNLPAIAYAVAYPGGIAGIIISLLVLRWWLRVDLDREAKQYAQEMRKEHEPFERQTLEVENPLLDRMEVARIPGLRESGITISRIRGCQEAMVRAVSPSTVVHVGDRILVVGTRPGIDRLQPIVGKAVAENLLDAPGRAAFTHLLVTAAGAIGQHLGYLRLGERFGVTITRVLRSGVEMSPDPGLRLHFGDDLQAVGERDALNQAAVVVGNQPQELNQTHFAPIFYGIALGVILGMLPIVVPGLPVPVRLGLAGGPLLIAIVVGRMGSLGRLVWHMPDAANRSIRELGISLFLASIGLRAGPDFFATMLTGSGALWVAIGLAITILPLLTIGLFARTVLRMNFIRISGLIAGSMTDPPALAFANDLAGNEGPAAAYAAVYPLTMLLRITVAQVLVAMAY